MHNKIPLEWDPNLNMKLTHQGIHPSPEIILYNILKLHLFIYYVYVYIGMWVTTCICLEDNLWEQVLSFYMREVELRSSG